MFKKTNLIIFLFLSALSLSCNMFMVAVRNVSTFFSEPEKVHDKIKNPIHPDARLSALWIGHSTVLLQMDDKIIITDPFLTETMGELARRVIEPGIEPENIPACDIILISHPHFDHLNYSSLEMLEKKSRKTALVFPRDLEDYLPEYKMKLVRMENDDGYRKNIIGETKIINGVKITTVYAQHWGGRYGLDGYLWGDNAYTGYMIEYNGMTVYFAGDTGYDPNKFKKLGEMYKIDLALIPIGPCAECRNCGTRNHVFPVEAVQIFKDTNPKWMVPIHYGTLQFAQADPMEPLVVLNEIINQEKLGDRINVLKIGEQKIFIEK
jgi:L-ascorbate metabolism protein UlaG (beta-lactamase superfamily)